MKKRNVLIGLLTFLLIPFGVNAESKTVNNQEELQSALDDTAVTEIVLGSDIETNVKINIMRDVTIDGANHTIRYVGDFIDANGGVSKDNTVWSKGTEDNSGAVYVLQAYRANVVIKDIALENGNRALGINGATVTLSGFINVSGNGFEAIELGAGSDVTEVSTLKFDDETIILNGDDEAKNGTLYVDDQAGKVVRVKNGVENTTEYPVGTQLSAEELNINLLYTIDDDINKVVPAGLFDYIKANSQILSLARLDDNDNLLYTWEFDSKDITNTSLEVNTNITFTEVAPDAIQADVSKVVVNYQNLSYLNFEHHGALPGKASVSYYVANKYDIGTTLYIAHFNETTKELEKVQEVTVDEDGSITFDVTECSSYVLYTGIDNSTTNVEVANAKTGDMNFILIMTLVAVAGMGLVITSKKIAAKVK